MKILLSFLMFTCAIISARAQTLDPSTVFRQDGILRVSDGSSYYEFNTNGTFKSFPVGMSGRTFTGTWTSTADSDLLFFTVTAKMGWLNGFQPPQDDWKIVFRLTSGTRHPAVSIYPAKFDCYWYIEELRKISKSDR